MREKPLTIATYAAGASLAAATLVYVFGPSFFLDDETADGSGSQKKKNIIGLYNQANDCFINSVLQALAGLPELRAALLKEVQWRQLRALSNPQERMPEGSQEKSEVEKIKTSIAQGWVTSGLRNMLDALNERAAYKKTISANPFIQSLEQAIRKRVSRNQQDAQEFLQVVLERLSDEHDAIVKAQAAASEASKSIIPGADDKTPPLTEDHEALPVFPMAGRLESQIECSFCSFKPKPAVSTFQTLTLNVPHNLTSTTLNACLDGLLKVEHIDDFVCDRCRLDYALQIYDKQLSKSTLSSSDRAAIEKAQLQIRETIENDPEEPPKDIKLPDLSTVPKRRIAKHIRIALFPHVLVIHLSRSVWNRYSMSAKNTAKVAFPEMLTLGGLLDRRTYRLLGMITHKGYHSSGHYETFRRQVIHNPPKTTNATMPDSARGSRRGSPAAPVVIDESKEGGEHPNSNGSIVKHVSDDHKTAASASTSASTLPVVTNGNTSTASDSPRQRQSGLPFDAIPAPGLPDLPAAAANVKHTDGTNVPGSAKGKPSLLQEHAAKTRKDRWWRISDDKIKECKTSDVLGMQQEVYLLFYELVPAT